MKSVIPSKRVAIYSEDDSELRSIYRGICALTRTLRAWSAWGAPILRGYGAGCTIDQSTSLRRDALSLTRN